MVGDEVEDGGELEDGFNLLEWVGYLIEVLL